MALALHYKVYGAGPPLIILHGLFGSSNNWHTLSGQLGEHFLVYAVDQRNHGQSPHSEEFTYGAMAEDLERFLADRGLGRSSILGHSMGGKTAMEFALRFPQKVEKLIVVDIAPRAYGRSHDEILGAMVSLDLASYKSREAIDGALQNRIPDERVRQFILTNLKRLSGGHYVWKINLEVLRAKYDEVTKTQVSAVPFPGPVLFIRGDSDYIREDDRALISRLFPHATLRSIPGAGHWVHADAPEEFFRVVLEFLQE
jgi:pimeloyl-ACP methyl ester carboxylesterase